jgi:hypothetical protein
VSPLSNRFADYSTLKILTLCTLDHELAAAKEQHAVDHNVAAVFQSFMILQNYNTGRVRVLRRGICATGSAKYAEKKGTVSEIAQSTSQDDKRQTCRYGVKAPNDLRAKIAHGLLLLYVLLLRLCVVFPWRND